MTRFYPSAVRRYEYAERKGKADLMGKDLLEKIEKAGVYEVSLRSLVIEKDGVGIDDRSVDRLIESAARRGGWIHYPVVQKKTMKVVVGKRRVFADKKAKKEKIWVRIVDLTDQEALFWRLEENTYRFNPDKRETYLTFKALRDDFHLKQTEIAEASGFSEPYVSKILTWGDGGFEGSPSRQKVSQGKNSVSSESDGSPDNPPEMVPEGQGVSPPPVILGGIIGLIKDGPPSDAAAMDEEIQINESGKGGSSVKSGAAAVGQPDVGLSGQMSETAKGSGPGNTPPKGGIVGSSPTPAPDSLPLNPPTPTTAGDVASVAPSFSTAAELLQPLTPLDIKPPVFNPPESFWTDEQVGLYRGAFNGFLQQEMKMAKRDPLAREHLEAILDRVNLALRDIEG